MSWQDVSVIQLRHAINDVDDPQRYNDNRLQLAWLVGAHYVVSEFTLAQNYVVDLVQVDITPDPTVPNDQTKQPADPWVMNLTTLRAAILMISNDLKLAANSAYSIRDVHMQADFKELYKANKMILDEAQQAYDNLRMQYCVGVQPQIAAVLTPINVISFGYRYPAMMMDARDRCVW